MTTFNTGNPIGSAAAKDLYDNAENLDEFVNSDSKLSHPDRLGVERKTWHGMEQDFQSAQSQMDSDFQAAQDQRDAEFQAFLLSSGYEFLGDYAAGIEVTAYNQIIRDGGEFWRLSSGTALPYTTTGAGMPEAGAFVSVGDAVLRQELADGAATTFSSTGSQSISAALNRRAVYVGTISELLDLPANVMIGNQQVSVKEYFDGVGFGGGLFFWDALSTEVDDGGSVLEVAGVPTGRWIRVIKGPLDPYMFGALPDGTDQSLRLQAMLDHGSVEFYIPDGVWRSDSDLTRTTDTIIRGPGVLDFSNAASAQLHISGGLTALDTPSTNMAKFTKVIRWASDQPLVPGDIVVLWNPTDYSFGGRRAVYRDGGMFKMHSVADGVGGIQVYEPIPDNYTAADFNAYRLDPVRVVLDGVSGIPCATASLAPIKVSLAENVEIRGVKSLQGGEYGGIQIDRCYNAVYDAATPENNSPHVGNEYGLIISNSQHVKASGAAAFATRHAVTLGGTDDVATVPCRYVTISGMSLHNSTNEGSGVGAADIHGNADYVTYNNCTMKGFSGGGRNIRVSDCTIFGMNEYVSGMCVSMPETNGGYVEFVDCTFLSGGDGDDSAHGYMLIQLLGSSAAGNPPEAWIREDVTIRVKGCRFVTPNAVSNAKMVNVSSANAGVKVNVQVDSGCVWESPQGIAFLFAREIVNAEMLSDFLIVDDVYGPANSYLIHPQATISNIPTREMVQRGHVDGETVANVITALDTQNYRYRYSRLPSATVGISSQAGGNLGTVGGQPPSVQAYNISETSIRPAIMAPSAFTAGANIRLHWSAGVFEV